MEVRTHVATVQGIGTANTPPKSCSPTPVDARAQLSKFRHHEVTDIHSSRRHVQYCTLSIRMRQVVHMVIGPIFINHAALL